MHLMNLNELAVTEEQYLEVIRRKTASLFEVCARIGAILAHRDREVEDATARYGLELGMAYQITDDVLDYSGGKEEFGENGGSGMLASDAPSSAQTQRSCGSA